MLCKPYFKKVRKISTIVTNLNSTWDIVLVTLIVRTVRGVGKVLVVEAECCHWNSMENLLPRLGELEWTAEISGVQ